MFSAGSKHSHPRATTAARYLAAGLDPAHMFRTDRGDDEGPLEWAALRVPGTQDPPGDDDVDILIRPSGEILVEYRNP